MLWTCDIPGVYYSIYMFQIVIPSFQNACIIICYMKSGNPEKPQPVSYLKFERFSLEGSDPRISAFRSSKFSMKKANGQWPRFLQANKGKTLPQALLCHWHISLEVLRDQKNTCWNGETLELAAGCLGLKCSSINFIWHMHIREHVHLAMGMTCPRGHPSDLFKALPPWRSASQQAVGSQCSATCRGILAAPAPRSKNIEGNNNTSGN